MSDITKTGTAHEEELTDAQLDQVSGGDKDFHFTRVVDSASPNLYLSTTPAPPPPPPTKS
jgi:type VI protein secretion system component Hcp